MADTKEDLEAHIFRAIGSLQKKGHKPPNILIETSPQNVRLIIKSNIKPVIQLSGDWSAITISHDDLHMLTNLCMGIAKGKGIELK